MEPRRRTAGVNGDGGAGAAAPLDARALAAKIQEYERFSNEVLKRDLHRVTELRARADREVQTWEELEAAVRRSVPPEATAAATTTSSAPPPLKTLVEVAPGVHCRAVVPDPSRLCVAVGLGFHVECRGQEEALRVAELRRRAAEARSRELVEQAARLKAQIKFVGEALAELMRLPR
jgi:prefoldin subunit 5